MEPQTQSTRIIEGSTLSSFYSAIYGWMTVGMAISAFTAYVTINSVPMLQFLASFNTMLVIVYIGLMIGIQFIAFRIPSELTKVLFFILAGLNGMFLSGLSLMYTSQSIVAAFVASAMLFGGLAVYGKTTKKDLSSWGTVIMIGMIGAFVASLLNAFVFKNDMMSTVLSAVIILVFSAGIAYNNQMYRSLFESVKHDPEAVKKASALGAIQMYISFMAIFQSLLNLFGSQR